MSRPEHRPRSRVRQVIGFAWYKPGQWPRLREISEDRDKLEDTYEEWAQNAEAAIRNFRKAGFRPKKVHVDVEDLLQWCHQRGYPVNGESRATYAADRLRLQQENTRIG